MRSSNTKKVLVLTLGNKDHASSRIRALQYFPFLERNNYIIKWIPRIPNQRKPFIFKKILFFIQKKYYYLLRLINLISKKWDIIFIQKSFIPSWVLKITRKNKIPIIFDFDDAIYINDNPKQKNFQKTESIIKTAKTIIVSSGYLAKFCMQLGKDPILISSPVNTHKIFPITNNKPNKICIGWIGSPWTTKYLYQLTEVFKEIALKIDFELLTVGARKDFFIEGINITNLDWSLEKENEHLNLMNIGIMPLTNDTYAEGKGGYKILQYMSAGIPSVVSPVGINNEIINPGKNGYLANSKEDWISYLELLLNNKDLRKKMGLAAREKALKKYSLDICSEKFINALELIKNQS